MKIVYKNGPLSYLMRASSTENYELITDNFINFSNSTYCVIFVQPQLDRVYDESLKFSGPGFYRII